MFVLFLVAGCGPSERKVFNDPVEPPDVLETFELADEELTIELFVSEPLIRDPVAMEIDENGDLYVVEMLGYPLVTDGSGQVKLLRDTNRDGIPDESSVFAEGLIFPDGIMRWKDGKMEYL